MTELHAISAFSFLEGGSLPEAVVAEAGRLGLAGVVIADRGGFYGSVRAHQAARAAGLRALVGGMVEWEDGSSAAVPVLCATRDGYRRLSRHFTDRHLLGLRDFPEDWRDGGLVALTGDGDGPLGRALRREDRGAAVAVLRRLTELFGAGNVFVEMSRHGRRGEERVNRDLLELAGHFRLPVVACNAPRHATRGERRLADAFTCLRRRVSLDQAGRLLAGNGERHVKGPEEMAALFADLPEALENTRRLAERLEFTLERLDYRFPDFPDSRGRPLSVPEQSTLLRRAVYAGAARRYGVCGKKVKRQLEHELEMIGRLGFPGYFLIVHELVEFARGRGILCQGRGSAANSAVCYALGITAVDPVGGGLLFERFLSENRRSWPDIDIDFPSGARREEVIQHVFRKYGARNAAMTANVISYRPRSAFREMSKALGFPPELADRFSRRPGRFHGGGAEQDGENAEPEEEEEGGFSDRVAGLVPPSHPRLAALEHLYHAALGMPRHLGQHPGGMIVCDRGLDLVAPLQPAAMPGRQIIQWDKDDCEDLGIVKIDLLGLGMLAAMEKTLEICSRRGRPVELAAIPKDDPAVFDLLCRADTVGTFQVESRAQMATLPIMRPRCFYDLAIEVAIIRPGPIVGGLLHPYLNRRNGREPVDCIHPDCRETLARTLGVPVFQEQVLRMAMIMAGFSGAEADELRRAMACKRSDARMERVTAKLRSRMTERGVPPEAREKVVASIGSFALYGFPESHAISFALIAYASCWLKAHRTAEFYTGLINSQPMGFYSVNTLLQDARRHGVRALPVCCVEGGDATETLDDSLIRLGWHRIKGLSAATRGRMTTEKSRAPFASVEDFLERVGPSESERRALARAGALNALPRSGGHRRQALWQVERPCYRDLFAGKDGGQEVELAPMSVAERVEADYRTQGASVGPHPMKLWRASAAGEADVRRASELAGLAAGSVLRIAGMAICRQRPSTAKGHCFISLEDETGVANLFVSRTTFHRHRLLLTGERYLLAEGRVQRAEAGQPVVYVTSLQSLPGAAAVAAESRDFH